MKKPTRNRHDAQICSPLREVRLQALLFGDTAAARGGSSLATSLTLPAQLDTIKYPNAAGE